MAVFTKDFKNSYFELYYKFVSKIYLNEGILNFVYMEAS